MGDAVDREGVTAEAAQATAGGGAATESARRGRISGHQERIGRRRRTVQPARNGRGGGSGIGKEGGGGGIGMGGGGGGIGRD
jgi:hypothetical protein